MPFPAKLSQQTILTAAMEQVSRDGVETLGIRGVAASLGVVPNAIYRYFSSLDVLRDALADESRRRLLDALRKASARKTPEQAIRTMAKTYIRFAREQPHVFALTLLPTRCDEENAPHVQSWRFVLDQVAAVYGDARAPEAAVALWAFLHGITVLEAARVFGGKKPASGFDFGLKMWLEGASRPRHT